MSEAAQFSIRFAGLEYQFYCEPLSHSTHIRKARALQIGGRVITAQPSQYLQLNATGTGWILCASKLVGPIPAGQVKWALADNRQLIQVYEAGHSSWWKIIKTVAQCYKCGNPTEMQRHCWHGYFGRGAQPGFLKKKKWIFWTPVCKLCLARFDEIFRKHVRLESFEDQHWEFLDRPEIDCLASQDRSATVRLVRLLVAPGKFTHSEFKRLCAAYGDICLRCGKSKPLVADHVVPIAKGGANDISNIQPLCSQCNGIKSDKSTDYRQRRRKHLA